MKWLALLGDLGYTILLAFNSLYNRYRIRRGKPYYSLSQHVKQKVKSAVNYISDFERTLTEFVRVRKYDGIICGHIHHPDNTEYEGIHYLNSGDWVETLSALAEDENGHWNIIFYTDIADSLPQFSGPIMSTYLSNISPGNQSPHLSLYIQRKYYNFSGVTNRFYINT